MYGRMGNGQWRNGQPIRRSPFGKRERRVREEDMSSCTRRIVLCAIAASAVLLSAGDPAHAAQTLRLLMPWNLTSAGNIAVGNHLIKVIEETTAGEIKISKFDNGV